MVMASHVLQRPISVYRPISNGVEIVVTYGDGYAAKEAINVLWSGAHYDLLLTPKQQLQQQDGA
jgi:OTU domain-containing protein 6